MKSYLLSVFLLFAVGCLMAQTAIAYPLSTIELDGNLRDWPSTDYWYDMPHVHGHDVSGPKDFSARFTVGYNEGEEALYIGVEVLDDEQVEGTDQPHTATDHMLLYLDAIHDQFGGSPVYYVATNEVLEVRHKPGTQDTRNHFLQLENAEVARLRSSNVTTYEWRIKMPGYIRPGQVLGLDFMLFDHDRDDAHETIRLWRHGFGKSYGSNRLGNLVLHRPEVPVSKISGRLRRVEGIEDIPLETVEIVSATEEDFFVNIDLDTEGYFQAFLPIGKYHIRPNQLFSSPAQSTGFNQNTRALDYDFSRMENIELSAGKSTKVKDIKVSVIERPEITSASKGFRLLSAKKEEVDEFVGRWQTYLEIPGISIALIRDNEVFYDRSFGRTGNYEGKALDEQSLFEAASITKAVFATMVLRLVEKGVIDLDRPLHEYLSFPNIEKDERSKLLTARIILGHQSGLPNWAWGGPGRWEGLGEIELNFTPGTAFGYSGEAFNYLGRVVEKVSGKSLDQIFKEEVAQPFGLKNSFFYYTDELESQSAVGHMHQYPRIKDRERVASPASSLTTNAHDFKQFVLGLMNEKHLSPASYQLIYQPYTTLSPNQRVYDPKLRQYISTGFFVQQTSEGKLIGHGGNNGDYDCKFIYNPEQKFGYIIFTNSNLGDEFIRAFEETFLR